MNPGTPETSETPEIKYKLPNDYIIQKVKQLKPYTTKQEKTVLLMDDDTDIKEVLAELTDVEPLNDAEALYLLLKLREISVSDVLEGLINCPHCQTVNETKIELTEDVDLDESIPLGVFESLEDFIDEDMVDELPLTTFNELEEKMKHNTLLLLNLERTSKCRVCGKDINITINPREILSVSSLTNIYQEYFNLGKFLHYSNRDVDVLLPFERKIIFNLVKKDIETPPAM